jgi:acetyl esterase/lipase
MYNEERGSNIFSNHREQGNPAMTNISDPHNGKSQTEETVPTIKRLPYGSTPEQFGDLYLPDRSHNSELLPIVMLFHGGFWEAAYDLTLMHGLAIDLVNQGLAVWNTEYRRVGQAGGGYPGTLQDVAAATDYLPTIAQKYGLDLQRVISIGHSSGGQLAFWSAARKNLPAANPLSLGPRSYLLHLRGVISLAGVVDLELGWHLNLGSGAVDHFMGGSLATRGESYALASPAILVPFSVPQILIHGVYDTTVPLEISQTYVRKARAAGTAATMISLVELPAAGHMEFIHPHSRAWHKTREILKQLI